MEGVVVQTRRVVVGLLGGVAVLVGVEVTVVRVLVAVVMVVEVVTVGAVVVVVRGAVPEVKVRVVKETFEGNGRSGVETLGCFLVTFLVTSSLGAHVFAPAFVTKFTLNPVSVSTNLEHAFRSKGPTSLR